MAELGLFPEPKILVLQGLVFLGALASANHFIISPALRLYNERKKRTSGAVLGAQSLENRAEAVIKAYNDELVSKTKEAKELRLSEVLAGQAEADSIINESIQKSKNMMESVDAELSAALAAEKAKLPQLAKEISASVLAKLISATAAVFAVIVLFSPTLGLSAGGGHVDPWEGIFWPLFQFSCFLVAVIYFGRKTMNSVLEGRRDTLRTQLSEAKQAVVLAERKAKDYEAKLSNVQNEVALLRKQYVQDGVSERNKMVAEAKIAAANMIRDAQRAANELVVKTREQLRKELVDLSLEAVKEQLSQDKLSLLDKHLKKEAMQEMHKVKSASPLH